MASTPEKNPSLEGTQLAIVGEGGFAMNLAALLKNRGLGSSLFVDEQDSHSFLGWSLVHAGQLTPEKIARVGKFMLAQVSIEAREETVAQLRAQGVSTERILPLRDEQDLQILRLLFARFGSGMRAALLQAGVTSVPHLEERFLSFENSLALGAVDPARRTIGLGYFGRGGGSRRHLGDLVPRLVDRFNVVTMSDEMAGHAMEAPSHLTLSSESARELNLCDAMLSAHVHPCAPASVPRVTFSHVIYDFTLKGDFHAERLAQSETHYLFASSRPSFDAYVDLVRRFGLRNRIGIIPGGYLQLDRNLADMAADPGAADALLYAPTLSLLDYEHVDLVTSLRQGPEILETLLDVGGERDVIYRPRPDDLRWYELGRGGGNRRSFGRMLEMCRTHPRLHLDQETSYEASYRRAALLVADTSPTAFTFAFSTGRPVVFFSPREEEMLTVAADRLRYVADREQIGTIATRAGELGTVVEQLLREPDGGGRRASRLWSFRDRMIFNPGGAAAYFVENIDHILTGEKHPDWRYFNW